MREPLRLFLVEDDDDVALVLRRHLERAAYHVTRCRLAADALIVLAQNSFDLVLLDQRLPDMEGLELLHRLNREGIAAPVLMITGRDEADLATRALQAGALDYLVKDPGLTFLSELPKRVAESVRRHRLEQSNRLLVQALGSARDGVLITDLAGTIIEVNRALEDQSGYGRDELLGQTPRLFKSGVHPPETYRKLWQTVLSRQSWEGELTNRRKDGRLRPMSVTVSPIVDNQGRLTHFVGIQRDLSETKRLEQQLIQMQKMQSVGTLAGGIAHEFNNLMAGINGYASLGLREPDVPADVSEFLTHIVDLSERAARLTRQLLAFARKPALTRQRTSLPELLRGTAELVTRTLRQEVTLDLPPIGEGDTLVVEADGNQLQQALINLALNGRDAILDRLAAADRISGVGRVSTRASQLIFRLRRRQLAASQPAFPEAVPPGDYLVTEVQDDGAGMTAEILRQSLDPFFTTKEVGQGTGLGLPTVYGIVQAHHGYLTIDSEPGRGTTICVYLPRGAEQEVPADAGPPAFGGDDGVVEPETTPGRTILVLDDEEAVADVVRRFLEIAGHRVHCEMTSQAGMDRVGETGCIDLVILDLMMPSEDPRITFEALRRRCPGVPVLLCTGLAETPLVDQLLLQPDTALLRKPFRMHELWYAVKQLLAAADRRPD